MHLNCCAYVLNTTDEVIVYAGDVERGESVLVLLGAIRSYGWDGCQVDVPIRPHQQT